MMKSNYASINITDETMNNEESILLMEEESPMLLRRIHRQSRLHRRSDGVVSVAKYWVVLVVLGLAAISALIHFFPSERELDLVYENDLSVMSLLNVRSAQSLANRQTAKFLNNFGNWEGKDGTIQKLSDLRNPPETYFTDTPEGCEATVMIVRHCEGENIREHCAHQGFERAVYLSTLFGKEDERWPAPSYIFAEAPGERRSAKKLNFRELETIGPLADKLGIVVDDSYSPETADEFAKEILMNLQNGQLCGKLTLISWKHTGIPHLAHKLGCGPEEGCPVRYPGRTYDQAWQIKYSYRKPTHSSERNLKVPKWPLWHIAGSVQNEGFDPLSFSKQSGDYPDGGTSTGARWQRSAVAYPERRRRSNTQWQSTRVGFEDQNRRGKHHDAGSKKNNKLHSHNDT